MVDHQVKMPLISKGSDFGKSEDKLPLDSVRRQSTNQTVGRQFLGGAVLHFFPDFNCYF